MRAWVAYRTFKTPIRGVGFYTVRHVLGADLLGSGGNFNLVIMRGPRAGAKGGQEGLAPTIISFLF